MNTRAIAAAFWNRLLDAGIYVNLALPPATPGNQSLLRTSVTAAHTPAQIAHAISVITAIGTDLGVIPAPQPVGSTHTVREAAE